ncbi:MAG: hypothetical protein LUD72_10780 [Bacteroidales bacterium]|nr:hypothetical protein [Bacteroidales bacterium]
METFESLQLNAGILLYDFDPENPATDEELYKNLMCATSGGISVNANPTYSDLGEDIDNCPKNTMELKHLDEWECIVSGTMLTMDPDNTKFMLAAADLEPIGEPDENGMQSAHIKMRNDLDVDTDFQSLWWVGDYGNNDGFVACHILNALSTGGLQIQSNDQAKATMDFEFTGHYSIYAQDDVPFDFYIMANETDNDDNGDNDGGDTEPDDEEP